MRRQTGPGQRIAEGIEAHPEASNVAIGKAAGASHETVAAVRRNLPPTREQSDAGVNLPTSYGTRLAANEPANNDTPTAPSPVYTPTPEPPDVVAQPCGGSRP